MMIFINIELIEAYVNVFGLFLTPDLSYNKSIRDTYKFLKDFFQNKYIINPEILFD